MNIKFVLLRRKLATVVFSLSFLHVISLVFAIGPGMVMAENGAVLPSKSEWLPGTLRRGADGKLYLETPEKKINGHKKREGEK